jgi:predicted Rossmann fold nucleotide-binding protein DprA/Smf involved in DNA uptake
MGGGAEGAVSIIKGLAEGIDACGHRAPLPRGRVCVFVFGGGGGGCSHCPLPGLLPVSGEI